MNQAILNQRHMNKLIAKTINSDERTAFMNASNVKRRLTVPVSRVLFVSLTNLCHKVGTAAFSNSFALEMVNGKGRKSDIKKCIRAMLNNVN